MALELIRDALGWCTLINFGLLIFWFLFFRMGRDWTYGFHGKWFRLAAEEFDRVHYRGHAVLQAWHRPCSTWCRIWPCES
jgi:hypothetical protein